jgi:hypothetical protein
VISGIKFFKSVTEISQLHPEDFAMPEVCIHLIIISLICSTGSNSREIECRQVIAVEHALWH